MIQKIALVELYEHSEVLRGAYELMEPYVKQLIIFTRKGIKHNLEEAGLRSDKIVWHTMDSSINRRKFLLRWQSELNSCGLIFFLTINRPFSSFSSLPFLEKVVLLIHNSHAFLSPSKHISWSEQRSLITILRAIRFYVLFDFYNLRKILKRSKILAFPSERILEYVRVNSWIPSGKDALVLPLGMYVYREKFRRSVDMVNICIPGTIKRNGRDYMIVYRVLYRVLRKANTKIRLCLLGKPKGSYGSKVQENFLKLSRSCSNFSVQLFTKGVPQVEFDQELQETDFLILPLVKYSRYDAFREMMGFTTVSGAINDMLRFGLPSILCMDYPIDDSMRDLISFARNEHQLEKTLLSWIKEERWIIRSDEAARINLMRYTEGKRQILQKNLSQLIGADKRHRET